MQKLFNQSMQTPGLPTRESNSGTMVPYVPEVQFVKQSEESGPTSLVLTKTVLQDEVMIVQSIMVEGLNQDLINIFTKIIPLLYTDTMVVYMKEKDYKLNTLRAQPEFAPPHFGNHREEIRRYELKPVGMGIRGSLMVPSAMTEHNKYQRQQLDKAIEAYLIFQNIKQLVDAGRNVRIREMRQGRIPENVQLLMESDRRTFGSFIKEGVTDGLIMQAATYIDTFSVEGKPNKILFGLDDGPIRLAGSEKQNYSIKGDLSREALTEGKVTTMIGGYRFEIVKRMDPKVFNTDAAFTQRNRQQGFYATLPVSKFWERELCKSECVDMKNCCAWVFDIEADNWRPISVEDAMLNCQRFDSEGNLVQTHYQLAKQIGATQVDNDGYGPDPFLVRDMDNKGYRVVDRFGGMSKKNLPDEYLMTLANVAEKSLFHKMGDHFRNVTAGIDLIKRLNSEPTRQNIMFLIGALYVNIEEGRSLYGYNRLEKNLYSSSYGGPLALPRFAKGSQANGWPQDKKYMTASDGKVMAFLFGRDNTKFFRISFIDTNADEFPGDESTENVLGATYNRYLVKESAFEPVGYGSVQGLKTLALYGGEGGYEEDMVKIAKKFHDSLPHFVSWFNKRFPNCDSAFDTQYLPEYWTPVPNTGSVDMLAMMSFANQHIRKDVPFYVDYIVSSFTSPGELKDDIEEFPIKDFEPVSNPKEDDKVAEFFQKVFENNLEFINKNVADWIFNIKNNGNDENPSIESLIKRFYGSEAWLNAWMKELKKDKKDLLINILNEYSKKATEKRTPETGRLDEGQKSLFGTVGDRQKALNFLNWFVGEIAKVENRTAPERITIEKVLKGGGSAFDPFDKKQTKKASGTETEKGKGKYKKLEKWNDTELVQTRFVASNEFLEEFNKRTRDNLKVYPAHPLNKGEAWIDFQKGDEQFMEQGIEGINKPGLFRKAPTQLVLGQHSKARFGSTEKLKKIPYATRSEGAFGSHPMDVVFSHMHDTPSEENRQSGSGHFDQDLIDRILYMCDEKLSGRLVAQIAVRLLLLSKINRATFERFYDYGLPAPLDFILAGVARFNTQMVVMATTDGQYGRHFVGFQNEKEGSDVYIKLGIINYTMFSGIVEFNQKSVVTFNDALPMYTGGHGSKLYSHRSSGTFDPSNEKYTADYFSFAVPWGFEAKKHCSITGRLNKGQFSSGNDRLVNLGSEEKNDHWIGSKFYDLYWGFNKYTTSSSNNRMTNLISLETHLLFGDKIPVYGESFFGNPRPGHGKTWRGIGTNQINVEKPYSDK
jgi:hypothetical protein